MIWWNERTHLERIALTVTLLLLIAGVIVACAVLPSSAWDFRNNLWGPTHLLLTGRSPYRIDQLFDGSNSVWMPTLLGAFLPLGWLTQSQAAMLWNVVTLITYLVIGLAATRAPKPYPVWLAVAFIAMLIFPPFVTTMQWGQFSVMAGLLALLAAELVERRAPLWALALCLVLGASKPQLMPWVGLGVALAVYQQFQWRGVVRLAIYALLWTGGLLLPLGILFPGWLDGLRWALGRNPEWLHPSSLIVLRSVLGSVGVAVWAGLVLAALGITVWLWRHYRPAIAVLWTLALTVLVTPYVWSYDFVLLIPLLIYTLFNVSWVGARLVWVVGYAALWLGFVQVRLTTSNSDELFWWVPLACVTVVGLCWGISTLRRPIPQLEPDVIKP